MSIFQPVVERRKLAIFVVVIVYCVVFHTGFHLTWSPTGSDILRLSLVVRTGQPPRQTNRSLRGSPAKRVGVLSSAKPSTTIAIGCAITSRGIRKLNATNVASKFYLFHSFMPTFCRTASRPFLYRFYIAYDFNDGAFTNKPLREGFERSFVQSNSSGFCRQRHIVSELVLVRCTDTGRPTWAQNAAMMEAYLDHVDFYYRINDDTKLLTGRWTERFIATLNSYKPPRVGVVGPNHSGGNTGILTYDFVHRTHVDLFGFCYPRVFSDWWGDNWITRVYKPSRSTKIGNVHVAHTLAMGQRYSVHAAAAKRLGTELQLGKLLIQRYVTAVTANKAAGVKPDGRKVISMSLYGNKPRYVWGAIRNAQLVPILLPDWVLRVHVTADPRKQPKLAVARKILNKLRLLWAEVVRVPTGSSMAPRNWRLLVADDHNVDYFLIRGADWRLSERESAAVSDWVMTAGKSRSAAGVVHCVRDHPKHGHAALLDGLWGGRPAAPGSAPATQLHPTVARQVHIQDGSW